MPNTSMSPTRYFTGETVRFWVRDLQHITDGAITTGATVLFEIVDSDDTVVVSAAGEVSGATDDWYADIDLPDTAGTYVFQATVTYNDLTWKSKESFYIYKFA